MKNSPVTKTLSKRQENALKEERRIKAKYRRFLKASPAQKRIIIVRDVIERIELNTYKPSKGDFADHPKFYNSPDDTQLQTIIPTIKNCEVCAKGALFLSCVVKTNNLTVGQYKDADAHGPELASSEMQKLKQYFSPLQLSLIETAFEGYIYDWNVMLTSQQIQKCKNFRDNNETEEYYGPESDRKVLLAICNNIIKNKGTFKP